MNSVHIFSANKLSTKKQIFFVKRLSFLLRSGVSTVESIHTIKRQSTSKKELRILTIILEQLSNGQTLGASMSSIKGVFNNFTINLISAGELSGTLNQNLEYLAEELRKKEMLRHKMLSALLYPLIIVLFTFGITLFLLVYIFPKITPIFKSINANLPMSTRLILYLSDTIRNHGVYIFLGLMFCVFACWYGVKKYTKVRLLADRLSLGLPIIGNIKKNYTLANVCRTLGLLLESGIFLREALENTASATENLEYKRILKQISKNVLHGKNISQTKEITSSVFGDMFGHMVAVGEKSGNLPETFLYLSVFYENEFDDATKNLSTIIEPVLMITMGIVVGFVAVSIITPIYEITNSLQR